MASPVGGKQVLLCASEAQRATAEALFPSLECRYLNGAVYDALQGRRVVCLGESLAEAVAEFAAECKILPDALPATTDPKDAIAWARQHAVPYTRNTEQPDHKASPPAAAGVLPPSAPTSSPPQGGDPLRAEPPLEDIPLSAYAYDGTVQPVAHPVGFPASPKAYSAPETPEQIEPIDFWAQTFHIEPMGDECFPPALIPCNTDEAAILGCDPGMMMLYRLAICAGCLTDEIRLQVRQTNQTWTEPGRLWLMIVGDSGLTMKSPAMDAAMAHAWKIEREMRMRAQEALDDYAIQEEIYQKQRSAYVAEAAKGAGAGTPPTPPVRPLAERLIVGNATIEAISDILLDQGERGVLVRADELAGTLAGMNQYKKGGNDKEEWLEGWNGGPHPIDRKGRAVLIKNFGWSVIGGIQPATVARLAPQLQMDTNGLLMRFTVYLPRPAERGIDRTADRDALQRYRDILDALVKMVPQPDLAPARFSPGAQAIADSAFEWMFSTMRHGWLPDALRSHLSKWRSIFARFCVIYHAIECADEKQPAILPVIHEDTVARVWALMRGLWDHAVYFYTNTLGGSSQQTILRQACGLILSERLKTVTNTTFAQRWSGWRKLDLPQRKQFIATLIDSGWLTPSGGTSRISGLPSHYVVNPLVHDGRFAEVSERERAERSETMERWQAARATRQPGED